MPGQRARRSIGMADAFAYRSFPRCRASLHLLDLCPVLDCLIVEET